MVVGLAEVAAQVALASAVVIVIAGRSAVIVAHPNNVNRETEVQDLLQHHQPRAVSLEDEQFPQRDVN